MAGRSKVKGGKGFRRLLRALPDAASKDILRELQAGGAELSGVIKARTPKRTGRLQSAITFRVYPKLLRLRVGLIGAVVNRKLFYGRILEFGRKAQIARATRRIGTQNIALANGKKKAIGLYGRYSVRVSPIAPKRFVTGAMPEVRSTFRRRLHDMFGRALRSLAGISDD